MEFQGYGQIQGTGDANFLPPIQGNTQVLPAITSDNFGGVLQETAGFGGTTDANGFFGTTATTNDIFGDTLKTATETNDFQNFQGTTTDTNAFFGTGATTIDPNAQAFAGTTTNTTGFFTTSDPIFANQTLAGTQFLPTTTGTTDPNAVFGSAQILPGQGIQQQQTTTTTTTQTTYNTQGFGAQNQFLLDNETIGTYALPANAIQSEYPATGPTTADANIGYGTTVADYVNAQANVQNTTTNETQFETIPPNPPTTFTDLTPVTQTTFAEQTPTITLPPPQPEPQPIPQPIPQPVPQPMPQPVTQTTQIVQNTVPVQPQVVQSNLPILQTRFGRGIMDEDFRRGRPIYGNDIGYGKMLFQKKNNNLPVRPIYNVGIYNTPKLLNYQNVGVSKINNNANVGAGLDRLGRGGSYDVYGRGITPLLDKTGLGQVQTTSKINDFL